MAPPPAHPCTGSSLLSLSSAPLSFTDAELAALKQGLARRGGSGQDGAGPLGAPTAQSASKESSEEGEKGEILIRATAQETSDGRFSIKPRKYQQQFASLYFTRLQQLRYHAQQAAKRHWPGVPLSSAVKDARPGVRDREPSRPKPQGKGNPCI